MPMSRRSPYSSLNALLEVARTASSAAAHSISISQSQLRAKRSETVWSRLTDTRSTPRLPTQYVELLAQPGLGLVAVEVGRGFS
jgi:hypothetical protein